MGNTLLPKTKEIEVLFDTHKSLLLSADTKRAVEQNGICNDGIIDEEIFENCKKKIIFLLKETNGTQTKTDENGNKITYLPDILKDWDYRKWLQKQQAYGIPDAENKGAERFYSKAFNKLCMWTDIFFDCIDGKDISFEEYDKTRYNKKNFREVLKKTGIVNLKKTWGGSSTDWTELNSYLFPDKSTDSKTAEFIREEIKIIEPDAVICGSLEVFDFAVKIYKAKEEEIVLSDGSSLKYFKHKNTIFINFYHPSCPGKKTDDMYNYAKLRFNAIKDMLND